LKVALTGKLLRRGEAEEALDALDVAEVGEDFGAHRGLSI